MKKKKIEDIFSSIENFSSVPPPELWAKIEEELDKPKKKKVVAIWWSLAASLLIGLAITSGLYFNSNENDILLKDNNVVIDSQESNSKSNPTTPSTINTTPLNNKATITVAESDNSVANKTSNNNQESTKTVTSSINKKDKPSLQLTNETISIAESSSKNKAKTSSPKVNGNEVNSNFNEAKNEEIVLNNNTQSSSKNDTNTSSAKQNKTISKNKTEAIVLNNNIQSSSKNDTNTSSAKQNNTEVNNTISKNKTEVIALNNNIQSSSKNDTNTSSAKQNNTEVNNTISKNKTEVIALNNNIQSSSKNDTNTSSAKQNNIEVDNTINKTESIVLNNSSEKSLVSYNDSLNKAQIALELQQLENRLNNKEDNEGVKTEKEILKEKWSVGLYAGLVNSENYGNKKALGNDIESKQNTGYGVKTNYKLNKKWAVSSGLKINELGQSVANVSYYNKQQNVLSAGIINDFFISNPSVEYISTNRNYVFSSDNSSQKIQSSNAGNQTGNLDQQLQYLEMPLEVSYSVLNTGKADIRLNTGGFIGKLISNEVFLDGNSIGGNLDVNNFVYGSKFSSTLQYEVFKKTHFFVEPGVNYYINPLKTQSFNQFQWGLNFGVNFGF
ncbi:hypothetical protein [Flavobacterium sp. PS2]|uniref:hypothetical protein n=1 Tax=Flavobacterium sp. PS2 TaxID=3384157 RepID=UPI00390C789F